MIETLQAEIPLAEKRVRPHIRWTYLELSDWLSDEVGCEAYLKFENLQITGSFKLRGALNKVLSLSREQAGRGVVTASTGNHGLAVARALRVAGVSGKIYLPPSVAPGKLAALRRTDVELELFGQDPVEAELEARRVAEKAGKTYVSPYNDLQVVAGQGTIGLELIEDLPKLEAVVVAVGGGGLISGIAGGLKLLGSSARVIGAQPARSAVMAESVRAGRIVDLPFRDTLSDATAGAVEKDSITFPLCRDLVDDFIVVEEDAIARAMRDLIEHHHVLAEGSAALAAAAFLQQKSRFQGKKVALILCGGNTGLETIRQVI